MVDVVQPVYWIGLVRGLQFNIQNVCCLSMQNANFCICF